MFGSPGRQPYHSVVAGIGNVRVAAGVHGHGSGAPEAGERQRCRGGRVRGQFEYPVVAGVGDVDGACRQFQHPIGPVN
jgi:hypothetical protein